MIELVEVSPRDGLQNERELLPTAAKVELIRRAIGAGVRRLEVTSFVNPRIVPQMADAEAVVAALPALDGVRYIGLVLNERGAERALQTGVHELGIVCAASDAFGRANQGGSREDTVAMAERVLARSAGAGRAAQATIAVAFGCPFEGGVEPGRIVEIARRLARAGAIEVALADTIGIGRPAEVRRLVAMVRDAIAPIPVRTHFHDTRGQGVANVFAAIDAGAATVDASIGGTGGCPFAPGAAGNVASEDVVFAFTDSFDVDLSRLVEAAFWLNGQLKRERLSASMRVDLEQKGL